MNYEELSKCKLLELNVDLQFLLNMCEKHNITSKNTLADYAYSSFWQQNDGVVLKHINGGYYIKQEKNNIVVYGYDVQGDNESESEINKIHSYYLTELLEDIKSKWIKVSENIILTITDNKLEMNEHLCIVENWSMDDLQLQITYAKRFLKAYKLEEPSYVTSKSLEQDITLTKFSQHKLT